ncbi:MAG TPA: (Fe-S)-binding protein [Acidimicrobiales bacterium]
MDLGIHDDELATCVSCGLCLPHCPTYRVTGEEALSPRGRIAAMRQVQWERAAPGPDVVHSTTTCVLCRGCETACPSGVPFGHLMEATREALASGGASAARPVPADGDGAPHEEAPVAGARPPLGLRLGLRALGHHRLLLVGSSLLGLGQRLRLVPARLARRFGLPARVPVRRRPLRPSGTDVWLFTGCVMDAWMRDTHAAVASVIEATGAGVCPAPPGAACCGALAQHAGLGDQARRLAERTVQSFTGSRALAPDTPILVDAAGCGALLRDVGRVVGTSDARALETRVLDVHEWLAGRLDLLPPPATTSGPRPVVAVQDPCHLRHVQRAHQAVRTVLERYVDVVDLDDEGLCCGAGGAYALTQPALAAAIRERKVAAIIRSGARLVASANPGCILHLAPALAEAGVEIAHPCEIVAELISRD